MSRWLKTGYHTQWVGAGNSYSVLYQVRDDEPYTFKPISNFLESMPLDRDPTDEGIPYPKTVCRAGTLTRPGRRRCAFGCAIRTSRSGTAMWTST